MSRYIDAEHVKAVMRKGQTMSDADFMTYIICAICDYAVANDMSPNETIKIIAENLLAILEISNFDGWKGADDE